MISRATRGCWSGSPGMGWHYDNEPAHECDSYMLIKESRVEHVSLLHFSESLYVIYILVLLPSVVLKVLRKKIKQPMEKKEETFTS